MFHGPSWTDLSCVPLCASRSENRSVPRRAWGRPALPAPLTDWHRIRSEEHLHHLPAEIGPLVTCRPIPRCRFLVRPGPPSRSP